VLVVSESRKSLSVTWYVPRKLNKYLVYQPFMPVKSRFSVFQKNTVHLYCVLLFKTIFCPSSAENMNLFDFYYLNEWFFFRRHIGFAFPAIIGVVVSDAFDPFKQYDRRRLFDMSFNLCCCLIAILNAIGLCFVPESLHSSKNFLEKYHSNAV
jgi:hypothetical protein